jgi:hypothetical protein
MRRWPLLLSRISPTALIVEISDSGFGKTASDIVLFGESFLSAYYSPIASMQSNHASNKYTWSRGAKFSLNGEAISDAPVHRTRIQFFGDLVHHSAQISPSRISATRHCLAFHYLLQSYKIPAVPQSSCFVLHLNRVTRWVSLISQKKDAGLRQTCFPVLGSCCQDNYECMCHEVR